MTGFWHGKRVLVTGHTGFKGSWLSFWLAEQGAAVYGLALAPDTEPVLFDQLGLAESMDHCLGDIRDAGALAERVAKVRPQVVFHLAAQPLVRRSYREPLLTWQTNVMGTANMLEALRGLAEPCAAVIVTTDKVYENREWVHGYRETDPLGGHDPYSASKAGAELVVASYRNSFLRAGPVRVASARAGNVIGGGDWAEDRIVPDLMRALAAGRDVAVRNPGAVRPWQHVLEPISGYLALAERLCGTDATAFETAWNFGPEPADQRQVRDLVSLALSHWPGSWQDASDPDAPHEAGFLSMTIDKARAGLGWSPQWGFDDAVRETVAWYRALNDGGSARDITRAQIATYQRARA